MKTSHTILTLLLVALAATFVFAGEEPRVQRHIKLALADGDEPLVIEADDLEVGESRQFFSESGKEVLLTRTEEGYDLEVDGKKIDIGMAHGGHHTFATGDANRVFVFKGDHEDATEGEHVFIHHGEESYSWVQDGGDGHDVDVRVLHHGHPTALEHLSAKGILDELDEDTRQKIVDALEELQPGGAQVRKMIMIEIDEKVHEEIHEDDE